MVSPGALGGVGGPTGNSEAGDRKRLGGGARARTSLQCDFESD